MNDLDRLEPMKVGSEEGVSADHVARARIHFLIGQHIAIMTQTQTADAKAAALLAAIGIAVAGGMPEMAPRTLMDLPVLVVMALSLAIASLCLLALIPRYATGESRARIRRFDRFSWPTLCGPDYGAEQYAAFMRSAGIGQLVVSLAHSNATVSRILLAKFRLLRLAFLLAILDGAAVGVALIF